MPDANPNEVSSDKDFEDAKHIYKTFKEKINKEKLIYFINLLKVNDKWILLKDEIN